MGLTRIAVRVSDLAGEGGPFEDEFLVDTGATDSMAPGDRLAEVGIEPEGRRKYELGNGEPVPRRVASTEEPGATREYEYAFARVAFMGEETVTRIIFGPPGIEPILGVIALESAGMTVDPVTGTLKRVMGRL